MRHFLVLVLFVLAAATASAAPSLDTCRTFLRQWEGYRTRPYADGPGWSTGIGHSLTAHAERGIWNRPYTATEIETLFRQDLSWALDAARAGIHDFDSLPEDVQLVVLSVAFGTGRTGFQRFVSFRLALGMRAYNSAAHQLYHSLWAKQVSVARRDHHFRVLRSH